MAISRLSARTGDPSSFGMGITPRGMRVLRGLSFVLGLLAISGCEAAQPSTTAVVAADASAASVKLEETRMWMTVGERRFAITLIDNAAAHAFTAQLPLTLDMSELNGNEKHADLPSALPTNPSPAGTIRTGDLMLYGTDTLVVFYLTFSPSYSYTRLGRVDDPTGLAKALGRRGTRVMFSKD